MLRSVPLWRARSGWSVPPVKFVMSCWLVATVYGLGFTIYGLRFRVWGLGFGVSHWPGVLRLWAKKASSRVFPPQRAMQRWCSHAARVPGKRTATDTLCNPKPETQNPKTQNPKPKTQSPKTLNLQNQRQNPEPGIPSSKPPKP